ncbi:hypothetical protein ACPOL_4000 [Acidisarcina polymorpha]|uniref:Uncharacterized protein n=1 Tax=Acidisarcina polymorpha TaxID=2211140 RepID=A0A2Z5G2L2_9BACT|nr:hypothetical protein ACPOL_4000 [Acidisarcina polymorpha]
MFALSGFRSLRVVAMARESVDVLSIVLESENGSHSSSLKTSE